MSKLLMAIALASIVGIGLTGCVESTSANSTPKRTTMMKKCITQHMLVK